MPSSTSSRASRLPTTTRSTSSRMRPAMVPTSARLSSSERTGSERIEALHHLPEARQVEAAAVAVLRLRPVGPGQVPRLRPQQGGRALGLAVEADAAQAKPVRRDAAHVRAQPVVDVEGRAQREVDRVLQLLERPDALVALPAPPAPRQT